MRDNSSCMTRSHCADVLDEAIGDVLGAHQLVPVVDHHAEVIGGKTVGLENHEIAELFRVENDLAADDIFHGHRSFLDHITGQRLGHVKCQHICIALTGPACQDSGRVDMTRNQVAVKAVADAKRAFQVDPVADPEFADPGHRQQGHGSGQ